MMAGTATARDAISVKGFAHPVRAYRVVGIYEELEKDGRIIREERDGFRLRVELQHSALLALFNRLIIQLVLSVCALWIIVLASARSGFAQAPAENDLTVGRNASMANPAAPESTLLRVATPRASVALLVQRRIGTSDRSICRTPFTSRGVHIRGQSLGLDLARAAIQISHYNWHGLISSIDKCSAEISTTSRPF
jgi:hypothetical protein